MFKLTFLLLHRSKAINKLLIRKSKIYLSQHINIRRLIQHISGYKMDTSRYYKDQLDDYNSDTGSSFVCIEKNNVNITQGFKENIKKYIDKLLSVLEDDINRSSHQLFQDCSMYTGTAGLAYLFYKYGLCFENSAYVSKAADLLKSCVAKFGSRREITFLTGIAGPLALSAVVFHHQGRLEEASNMIAKLKSLSSHVLDEGSRLPDELLYGRVGYLFALLFVNSHISPPPIEDDIFKQIIAVVIRSGNRYSTKNGYKVPIMFSWHDTEYIGAAHGLAGILYILLQARQYLTEEQLQKYIKPALQYLLDIRYNSGNFPSSIGSRTDKLVHWCHGAPGIVMLFCLAYEVFKDDIYLKTALQCGEVVWERGLLRKGYGICHGVAGNAYTFLCLFQQTKDIKQLYRATQFADWCFHYGKHQNRTPDAPCSLFEGIAGTIFFLIDMQTPALAKFPGYTL